MRLWPRQQGKRTEACVYRVPGPGDEGEMWIARTVTGQVAHGRTPEGAIERLRACVEALAAAEGTTVQRWCRTHRNASAVRFVRRRELLQA